MSTVDLKLTEKQSFMIHKLANVDEVFYGGQAGGGKSEGLLMFALKRRIECPGSVGLMLRRTFPELDKSLIRKSKQYFSPYAKWKEQKRLWQFKPQFGGGIQEFGYSVNDKDVDQYQSAEYDDICLDEGSHFTEYQYTYLSSRLRPRGEWKTLMRIASNPGNIGHQWLKARFVDPARDKIVKFFDEEEGTFKARYFLPATLGDNTLMSEMKRKEYRAWLNALPEAEKLMLRDGDWDFVPGAAFPELHRKTHGYDRREIPVPSYAKIIMGFDWGFGKPFSVAWYWTDYDERLWRFAEWYGWNGKPDQGLRMASSQIARGILDREKVMGIQDRIAHRPSDPSVFGKKPNLKGGGLGPSVAEMMANEGVYLSGSDNDRLMGKSQFHERLRIPMTGDIVEPGDEERPMLMIANQCEHFWRTVPVIPLDDKNIEDVDSDAEDHDYDQTRYVLMSRPINPIAAKPELSYPEKIMRDVKRVQAPIEELAEIYNL